MSEKEKEKGKNFMLLVWKTLKSSHFCVKLEISQETSRKLGLEGVNCLDHSQ